MFRYCKYLTLLCPLPFDLNFKVRTHEPQGLILVYHCIVYGTAYQVYAGSPVIYIGEGDKLIVNENNWHH